MPEADRLGDARRILVYGVTGSGKSTLARTLGELTGIPVTSVDDITWNPGWLPMPTDEQIATFDQITRGDAWILDSAYGSWRHMVHERADLVVALDYPRLTSLARLLRRTVVRVIDGQDVCNGNRESLRGVFARDSIVWWHFTSFRRKRAEMRAWQAAGSGARVIRLESPADARALIENETARRRDDQPSPPRAACGARLGPSAPCPAVGGTASLGHDADMPVALHPSVADAAATPYWLDRPDRPAPRPSLEAHATADLCVVGGGYSGLWTAILAKERDPSRDVMLLEGNRIGWAASGRNGGFCAASITHGHANGADRWPDEIETLDRLGRQNLDEIEKSLTRYGVDCGFHRPGAITVATEPHQLEWLGAMIERNPEATYLDRDEMRAEVSSPTFLAGVFEPHDTALVDPARLAWGLAAAAESLGVRIHERTHVSNVSRSGAGLAVRSDTGAVVRAGKVALGTNAFPSLVRRVRLHTVPVYDYALMSEPLSPRQLEAIGWRNRQGLDDITNQFHYFRMTEDDRILWGGYDAIYHFGRRVRPSYDQRPATFDLLARQFFTMFPQLEGLRFSHRWGGAIDTCTRFCAFFGTAYAGRAAYALGYTGLGVGASRFGADVMLDLLDGVDSERTRLELVRTKPLPFPPEPFAWTGIELTRRSLAAADRNQGRRDLWLRTLDRFGLGFDS